MYHLQEGFRGNDMPNDAQAIGQLAVRIAVLESFSVAALGIYLANWRTDPGVEKAKALVEALKHDVARDIADFPEEIRKDGEKYLSELALRVIETIPALRGDGSGQSH